MKNSQKGSAVPYLIAIIALLLIGGGYYIFAQKSQLSQSVQSPVQVPSASIDSSPTIPSTKLTIATTTHNTNTATVKRFDENVTLADKSLGLGFGSQNFLAKGTRDGIVYTMVYDQNTTYDLYITGTNTLYQHGDFTSWLSRQSERYQNPPPQNNGPEMETWYAKYKGTGSARILGSYIDGKTIKVEKVVTYVQ
jgi:hypothetical protein